MTSNLTSKGLLSTVISAIKECGYKYIILNDQKPFHFRISYEEFEAVNLYVYIWNCTHGGGAARARDEFRIQITGTIPHHQQNGITLLLGWHSGYEVFVGFDLSKHSGQASASPSIQVKEEALKHAYTKSFSIYLRQNSEIAVAFRKEFFIDYALNCRQIHKEQNLQTINTLNNIDTITDEDIKQIPLIRQRVTRCMRMAYRRSDFRKRVLGAYNHTCAACGIQLDLIDAAHIVPVAIDTSTDDTNNGVALCKLHHAAYDNGLMILREDYSIKISQDKKNELQKINHLSGIGRFETNIRQTLILPNDRRDYPDPDYISHARRIREMILR